MSDPLAKVSDHERELFEAFARMAKGFQTEHVLGAAANIIVNAIRQGQASQRGALASFDEIAAKTRALLAEHYDGTGKRRNVFPFHQVIEMPKIDLRRKQ